MNNLKKIFYYIGVYDFCVFIHYVLNGRTHYLDRVKDITRNIRKIKDIADGKETEKEEIGVRPKKVVNKIGF